MIIQCGLTLQDGLTKDSLTQDDVAQVMELVGAMTNDEAGRAFKRICDNLAKGQKNTMWDVAYIRCKNQMMYYIPGVNCNDIPEELLSSVTAATGAEVIR